MFKACGYRRLAESREVHQEVWTRVYIYRKRYNPDRPFRAYLFTIAVNCCRTAIRQEASRWALVSLDAM